MNRLQVAALWVGLAIFSWGSAQDEVPPETAETVTVRLVVETEPGVLISRLNPSIVELDDPFRLGDALTATVDGEPYLDDPEVYYARLNPVIWELPVPQGAAPGGYPSEIRATFALCSRTQGSCFIDEQTAMTTVQVGGGANETVVVRLRQPER